MADPADEDIHFLTLDVVLLIHARQIAAFGGSEGVRDRGLVDSALAQPRQMFAGQRLHPDLAAMAGAYLYHLVSNHGFVDGNKRAGAHAALVFLARNGVQLTYRVDEAEALTVRVAAGQATKDEVIAFFRLLIETAHRGP